MKALKKAVAFALTVVMAVSAFSFTAFAQSEVTIKGDKDVYNLTFEKDKTFDLNFMIENNTQLTYGEFVIKYDPTVIQAVTNDHISNDGYFGYEEDGEFIKFVDDDLLNTKINTVPAPEPNDSVYEGKNDGVKSEAEIGIIKMAAIHFDSSGFRLIDTKSGKFFTICFKMVGEGSTKVEIAKMYPELSYILVRNADETVDVDITPVTVNLTAGSNSSDSSEDTTATTVKTEVTTTEATTEKATVTEESTEVTTKAAENNENVKTFEDIANYPWAKTAIESLATKGIINGVGNGNFNPSANVKRADFLLMLMNALDIKGEAKSSFADVSADKYYANAVCLAKDLGIAKGKNDNTFCPEEMISRQDMMVLASNAIKTKIELEEASNGALAKFSDKAEISAYAEAALAQMVNAGIVNGTGSKLEPKANTTRAQAAVIIYNIYNKVNE